jgi:hypothetical protein
VNFKFSYLGHSRLVSSGSGGQMLNLEPNLSREAVAFDAALRHPLRFREAMSALHDVVISDLRFKKRDKTAYEAWKKSEAERVRLLRTEAYKQAKREIIARQSQPVPHDLDKQFHWACRTYWGARREYADYLRKQDMELWRLLMPCDPVITVADDVVFFECFSADESSYGCLTVNRADGFGTSDNLRLGTTNVDYSWDLYHHFQALRSYRETRFRLDPAGFEVATHGSADYREEKIDLPTSWLRGFMQIQTAMALPMRKVTLTREAVYSLLAWLKRHKARTSPRAVRFEFTPGQPPMLVLEPWEQRIVVHGAPDPIGGGEPIRIWGRQRLLTLARLLPLVESVDVYLLGTGFPSFWVAKMGEMQLTLGLSGWTTNDWTRGSALDLLAPPVAVTAEQIALVGQQLQRVRAATFADLVTHSGVPAPQAAAALNHLAHSGQMIADLPHGVYRWRQIMSQALGEAEIGPENPESAGAREILARKRAVIESKLKAPSGGTIYTGKAESKPVEVLLDADGRIKRGKCLCGHFQKAGLRMGPCRHLLALRSLALQDGAGSTGGDWMQRWSFSSGGKGGV